VQRELYDGEEFYLQIDSHSRFVPGWDERLVAMLARCGSPKAVLSTYPLPYEGAAAAARVSTEERLTLLCTRPADAAFDADGMLRFRARLLAAPPCAPVPTAFWAAGFSFSRGELVREVRICIYTCT
jgi:[Skp1-protein]-hydroxyproline N-acetylglucosaminyltransferase